MKKKLNIIAFTTNILLLAFLACMIYNAVGAIAFFVPALGVSQLFFKSSINGAAFSIQTEVWVKDIMENLYENNEFIKYSVDHTPYAINKVVHVPQAGSNPGVQVNRAVLPATSVRRTDTDLTYQIDELTVDPVPLTYTEELQVSYAKRKSIMSMQYSILSQTAGIVMSYDWAAVNKIIRTSGTADTTALAPSATGTRKRVVLADIQALAQAMDKDNIPHNGRKLLMPVDMYYQLFPVAGSSDITLVSSFTLGQATLPDGRFPNLYGFELMLKPTVAVYDNTIVKKPYTTAAAATDLLGAIAWHPDYVGRAIPDIQVFISENRAEYYGTVFSALGLVGGRALRADEKGIFTLVQG